MTQAEEILKRTVEGWAIEIEIVRDTSPRGYRYRARGQHRVSNHLLFAEGRTTESALEILLDQIERKQT